MSDKPGLIIFDTETADLDLRYFRERVAFHQRNADLVVLPSRDSAQDSLSAALERARSMPVGRPDTQPIPKFVMEDYLLLHHGPDPAATADIPILPRYHMKRPRPQVTDRTERRAEKKAERQRKKNNRKLKR